MVPEILFQGVFHQCEDDDPGANVYYRVAHDEIIDPEGAEAFLGLSNETTVNVQLAEDRWPGEEEKGHIWEIYAIPPCIIKGINEKMELHPMIRPFASRAEAYLKFFEDVRYWARWEKEEEQHPPIVVELPVRSIPKVISLEPEINTVTLSVSQIFRTDIWPSLSNWLPEGKLEEGDLNLLRLPIPWVTIKVKLELKAQFLFISDRRGENLLLYHEKGEGAHIHFYGHQFEEVAKSLQATLDKEMARIDFFFGQLSSGLDSLFPSQDPPPDELPP